MHVLKADGHRRFLSVGARPGWLPLSRRPGKREHGWGLHEPETKIRLLGFV
jgi:hypothetical protein